MASRPSTARRQRLALGSTHHRLKYEQRIRIWLLGLVLPTILCATFLVYERSNSVVIALATALALVIAGAATAIYFFEQLIRPLQTLANVVSALREDDFSFRARGARRGDALGDLALEINALASTLQGQRTAAQDALTLVERVMTSMQSPVLAFDDAGYLRLLNPAAEAALHLQREGSLGRSAADLDLTTLLYAEDKSLYSNLNSGPSAAPASIRWSVRRTTFRLQGIPHTLLVLSDIAAALREEERVAWQRLIRVLSHEINNSLTPIKSIAGSLRTRLPGLSTTTTGINTDLHRGLAVIEERAAALNRFLQAYQQLTRLPAPQLQWLSLDRLLEQVVHLETRLPVEIQTGPPIRLLADPDQLQQLLINLLRNAVEAALGAERPGDPQVVLTWSATPTQAILHIRDNGLGLMNPANLFVPFYTTKPEGSGIGLVLAQQIATAHKGSVALFNNTGAPGCTAELRLPIEEYV
jgi:two-component system, NtrC family, nitrogen regulation sensor histidine kinase NtrY